ncbi:hypothetical protein BH11MYX1_BH11MYX1_36830 [soil metagenome]
MRTNNTHSAPSSPVDSGPARTHGPSMLRTWRLCGAGLAAHVRSIRITHSLRVRTSTCSTGAQPCARVHARRGWRSRARPAECVDGGARLRERATCSAYAVAARRQAGAACRRRHLSGRCATRIAGPTLISVGQATVGFSNAAVGLPAGWARELVRVSGNVGLSERAVTCFPDGTETANAADCCNGGMRSETRLPDRAGEVLPGFCSKPSLVVV